MRPNPPVQGVGTRLSELHGPRPFTTLRVVRGSPDRSAIFLAGPFLLAVFLSASACAPQYSGRPAPVAVQGVLDLRSWDFTRDGPVQLNGAWEFYWKKFSRDIRTGDTPGHISPGAWNGFRVGGSAIGALGFGTYRLRVLLPDALPALVVKSGGYDSAVRLTHGGAMHEIGRPGRTRATTRPVYRQELLDFTPTTASVEFLAEVSNFFHKSGGMLVPPMIGKAEDMRAARTRTESWQAMLAATFLIFGVYHVLLHLIRRNPATLYFGLYCLLFCVRTMQTGDEIVHIWLPDLDLRIDLALEYLGMFLLVPCAVLCVGALFPGEFPSWLKRAFVVAASVYSCTLLLPSETFSRLLIGYQVVVLAGVASVITVAVLAVYRRRDSARIFLMGFLAVAAGTFVDVLGNIMTSISTPFASIGMVGFVLAQAVVIARRFSNALHTSEELAASLQIAYDDAVQLRRQLARKEKMATVGDMAAGIVHDLKNPVAVIKGYAEMADEDQLGRESRRRYLSVIGQESDRLLDMVHDLLDFSRGSVAIHKSTVDFSEFLARLERAAGPTLEQKHIQFSVEGDVTGPVHLDPDRLLRAIMNIVSNAADVLPLHGQFTMRVSRSEDDAAACIVFQLSDTGPGIPADIQATLFEPFVTSGKPHGTGLGMAIAKSLVEAHGGSISFVTEIGQGTTFTIVLPV